MVVVLLAMVLSITVTLITSYVYRGHLIQRYALDATQTIFSYAFYAKSFEIH